MISKLPIRLKKEPLVDVTFELRFQSSLPVSSIIPGVLFGKFACSAFEKTPIASIPRELHEQQAEFSYQPLIKMMVDNVLLMASDKSIIISSPIPYIGWAAMRPKIFEILSHLNSSGLIGTIQRHSIKYTGLLESTILPPDQFLNAGVRLGSAAVSILSSQIRTQINDENKNIITLVGVLGNTSVQMISSGETKSGCMVEIDCIQYLNDSSASDFLAKFDVLVTELHDENVRYFFDCLSPKGIAALEPEYE